MSDRAYAAAGVDYAKIDPFKHDMAAMAHRTLAFPRRRKVRVDEDGMFSYRGKGSPRWKLQIEGLGNKDWIAEAMYRRNPDPRYFAGIGVDTAMMAVYDLLRSGALPVIYADEVAARTSDWFADEPRRSAIIKGFYQACQRCGMALVGGESPAYRFLIRSTPPVEDAGVFSGAALGIIPPGRKAIRPRVRSGDIILGAPSTGLHANGASRVIAESATLADGFFADIGGPQNYGEEALIPCANYVPLVEALLDEGMSIHAIVPITGGGVAKLAAGHVPFTYRITDWVKEYPRLFRFLLERGISLFACLTTFNMGIGMCFILNEAAAEQALTCAKNISQPLHVLGYVEAGRAGVIFGPEGSLELPPPGS